MKKIIIMLVIALYSITINYAAPQAKIFFVNLYNENADVQLGEDNDPVFTMTDLEPYNTTVMSITHRIGSYKLYFKTSAESKWYFWADKKKQAYFCPIKDGDVICILFGYEGAIHFLNLKEPKGSGAFVCLLNGTNTDLAKMSISTAWEDSTNIYMDNMKPDIITNLILVKPGKYGLFWQFPDQVENEEYFFYPDDNGDVDLLNFEKGKYYIFMSYTKDSKDYAVRFEISP